jgi:hypothetical protein
MRNLKSVALILKSVGSNSQTREYKQGIPHPANWTVATPIAEEIMAEHNAGPRISRRLIQNIVWKDVYNSELMKRLFRKTREFRVRIASTSSRSATFQVFEIFLSISPCLILIVPFTASCSYRLLIVTAFVVDRIQNWGNFIESETATKFCLRLVPPTSCRESTLQCYFKCWYRLDPSCRLCCFGLEMKTRERKARSAFALLRGSKCLQPYIHWPCLIPSASDFSWYSYAKTELYPSADLLEYRVHCLSLNSVLHLSGECGLH